MENIVYFCSNDTKQVTGSLSYFPYQKSLVWLTKLFTINFRLKMSHQTPHYDKLVLRSVNLKKSKFLKNQQMGYLKPLTQASLNLMPFLDSGMILLSGLKVHKLFLTFFKILTLQKVSF